MRKITLHSLNTSRMYTKLFSFFSAFSFETHDESQYAYHRVYLCIDSLIFSILFTRQLFISVVSRFACSTHFPSYSTCKYVETIEFARKKCERGTNASNINYQYKHIQLHVFQLNCIFTIIKFTQYYTYIIYFFFY